VAPAGSLFRVYFSKAPLLLLAAEQSSPVVISEKRAAESDKIAHRA